MKYLLEDSYDNLRIVWAETPRELLSAIQEEFDLPLEEISIYTLEEQTFKVELESK